MYFTLLYKKKSGMILTTRFMIHDSWLMVIISHLGLVEIGLETSADKVLRQSLPGNTASDTAWRSWRQQPGPRRADLKYIISIAVTRAMIYWKHDMLMFFMLATWTFWSRLDIIPNVIVISNCKISQNHIISHSTMSYQTKSYQVSVYQSYHGIS